MISGDLAIQDLPGAWNERIRTDLGIDVPDDRRGCLQDVHWSIGALGYFPTYTLGNLYAAQLWSTIRAQVPDLDDRVSRGDFAPLLDWLVREIHVHGRRSDTPAAPRQGARRVRPGRRAADGGDRPRQRLRRRAPAADPAQGRGAHADLRLVVRPHRGPGSPTTSSRSTRPDRAPIPGTRRDAIDLGAPLDAGPQARALPGGVRGARLPLRLGVEGVPGARHARRRAAAPRGCASRTRLDPPLFSPATKAERGTTRTSPSAAWRRSSGAETAARCARRAWRLYERGRDIAERAASSSPTRSSSSAATPTARCG
jgi:hypothetical protein